MSITSAAESAVKGLTLRPIGYVAFHTHKTAVRVRAHKVVSPLVEFIRSGLVEGYQNGRNSFIKNRIIKEFNRADTNQEVSERIGKLKALLLEMMPSDQVNDALKHFRHELLHEISAA